MTIGILCTHFGNVASIARMIERAGAKPRELRRHSDFNGISKLILPGVGHFDEGMRSLRSSELLAPLMKSINEKRIPILGVCLGMQLLCSGSEEGLESGLGVVKAVVKRFVFSEQQSNKVPHMGWNVVLPAKENPLLPMLSDEQRYYFIHSYKVVPDDPTITIGYAEYGGEFCAAFQQENIFGVQFHPEKSHRFGLGLMKRFVSL